MPAITKSIKRNKAADKKMSSNDRLMELLNKDFSLSSSGLKDRDRERFYSEIYILLSSGIDIRTTLELVAEQITDKRKKKIIDDIHADIISGMSLSESMSRSGKFSAYESFGLKIGEESGNLNEVLRELSSFYQKRIRLKRQMISALSYPAIVITVAGGTIGFLLHFVVPMFSDIFKRFGSELPAITRFIINLSDLSSVFFFWAALFTILILILYGTQRKKEWFRKYSSSVMVRIPILGPLIRKIYVARFCLSMKLLMHARTPLLSALDLASSMIEFYPIERSLYAAREGVLKGESLHQSFSKQEIYDKRMVSLIRVAEEVNQLDIIFAKLAQQYSDEADHQTSVLSSLIEPLMIVFLGVVVSLILIAVYLPLFQLNSSF